MIRYLKEHFPESGEPSERTSLAIAGGESGARLTHSHAKQYAFVLQSLTLWREIANDMFRLWYLAEDDLVRASNPYAQRDTGQGLQRVQHAPRTTRAMHQLLHTTQSKCGSWVGSSLIHLGDSNVPNALMFIDKYSQVREGRMLPHTPPLPPPYPLGRMQVLTTTPRPPAGRTYPPPYPLDPLEPRAADQGRRGTERLEARNLWRPDRAQAGHSAGLFPLWLRWERRRQLFRRRLLYRRPAHLSLELVLVASPQALLHRLPAHGQHFV